MLFSLIILMYSSVMLDGFNSYYMNDWSIVIKYMFGKNLRFQYTNFDKIHIFRYKQEIIRLVLT